MATAIAFRVTEGSRTRVTGAQAPRRLSPREVRILREYVDGHIDEAMTLRVMAGVLNLSHWHFLRCFKATFGLTPHAFVTQRRLARAKEMLQASRLRIVDIAIEIGMSHSHFSRSFLSHFGTSPREYRRGVRR